MKANIVLRGVGLVAITGALAVVMSGARDNTAVAASPTDDINPPMTPTQQAPEFQDNGLEFDPLSEKDLAKTYGVDVDSPEDTLRRMTIELQRVREESERMKTENDKLRRQANQLLNMEDQITGKVEQQVAGAQADLKAREAELAAQARENQSLMQRIEARIKQLESATSAAPSGPRRPGSATSAGGYDIGTAGIPDGLGFGDSTASDEIIWKNPLDATVDPKKGTVTLPEFKPSSAMVETDAEQAKESGKLENSVPAYTIPQNATLMASTSMTALLGRIPINGVVTDPYPFKLIVGPDNLASNGINIPNVSGIVMSGKATGDLTLKCVSGEITSMTFTFNDGSISTYPDPKSGSTGETIGWFSDRYGIPCVSGRLITNAVPYLAGRVGLGAVGAYAGAIAEGEYSTTTSPEGSTRSLTGDAAVVGRNAAIQQGLNEVGTWLDERMDRSFDVVYVEPGTEIAIHVEKELKIDYPINGSGRKVQHQEYTNLSAVRVGGLD